MPARGCGSSRTVSGIYLEVPVGANGHPIEEFLIDPPLPVDVVKLGISPVGVHAIEVNTSDGPATWLFDWIGSEHYPNVVDYLEETRNFGVSRRAPASLPWEKIDSRTRLVLLHARAVIDEPEAYYRLEQADMPSCPQVIGWEHCQRRTPKEHPPGQLCGRLWWQDVVNGEPVEYSGRRVARTVGETTYQAWARPAGLTPTYHVGMVARFPVPRVAVIRDRESGTHEDVFRRVQGAGVPTYVADE